jgi:hypothetical protein
LTIKHPSLWFIPLMTLIVCAGVASRQIPLWIPGQCAWAFRDELNGLAAALLLAILIFLSFVYAGWMRRRETMSAWREASHVALVCALALVISLATRIGENFGLARLAILTINPASGGYLVAAYDTRHQSDWLERYPDVMKKYHHVATHPPGGVALMRWWLAQSRENRAWLDAAEEATVLSPGARLNAVAEFCAGAWQHPYNAADVAAAFWGGFTFLLFAALMPACVYLQTRVLYGVEAAINAATLSAMVPSFVLFAPSCDLTYAFCSALTLALVAWGTARNQPALLFAAGVVAGCGIAFSFAVNGVVLIAIGFVLLQSRGTTWQILLLRVGLLLGGIAVVALLLHVAGLDWLATWRGMSAGATKANVESGRDYKVWLFFNLADFFTFLGLPATALVFIAIRRALTDGKDLAALLLPSGVAILLTDVLGYTPAETARIWMLFMPPLLALAGAAATRAADARGWLPKIVFASQAIQLLVFSIFFNVWSL